jgi:putative phosphoesterase
MNRIVVGVVADTHGYLNPRVLEALQGVEHILVAGDICGIDVIKGLEEIAPVTAVRGNNDRVGPTSSLPEEAEVVLGGKRMLVRHEVRLPKKGEEAPAEFRGRGLDVVVFGHSHYALVQCREGILFFNPGAAGKRRFNTVPSVGVLEVAGGEVRAEVVRL